MVSSSDVLKRLKAGNLAAKVGVPAANEQWFYRSVANAVSIYRKLATQKGNPDSPSNTARQLARVGRAAISGSTSRKAKALAALTPKARKLLQCLAGAQHAWKRKPTDDELATAAVVGSGPARPRSAARRAKSGPVPPRTVGQLGGGRPPRPEIDILASLLAAALSGATGKPATRGSKNLGADGALIPSALETLVTEVQAELGELGQWNPVDRVRDHVARSDGKPVRKR